MTNKLKELALLLKIYTTPSDPTVWKHLSTLLLCTFLFIYSILLITEGYYSLIFLVIGFSLGAFYFTNNDGNFKINLYERNLSYSEQALEQVKYKNYWCNIMQKNTQNYFTYSSVIVCNQRRMFNFSIHL